MGYAALCIDTDVVILANPLHAAAADIAGSDVAFQMEHCDGLTNAGGQLDCTTAVIELGTDCKHLVFGW